MEFSVGQQYCIDHNEEHGRFCIARQVVSVELSSYMYTCF